MGIPAVGGQLVWFGRLFLLSAVEVKRVDAAVVY